MEHIIFEKKDHIGWFTLNRPKQLNALSLKLMNKMQKQLDNVAKDLDVNVIVIRANGPAFCVGHDITELNGKNYDINHFCKIFTNCSKLMLTLHKLPQPVIAQVYGNAMAAGCKLVASCDLAIAGNNEKFSTPGLNIGLFCSTPMVPLSRIIGRRRALDMLLTGRFVSAEEAEKFGLVNKVVQIDKLAKETKNWAAELSKFNRFTLEYGKKAFYHQIDKDEVSAITYAKETIAKNCLSEDAQEGMQAFLERCKTKWKNR